MTVSIVMTTRNRAKWLEQAVESIISQSYKLWELDVVDDASTDDTPSVLKSLSDPRIYIHRNETNIGAGLSRRPYMLGAKRKYLAVLDDDDWWQPWYLGKMVDIMEQNPSCPLAYCDCWRLYESGKKVYWDSGKGKPFPNILPSCTLMRTDIYQKLGGWDTVYLPGYHSEADYYYRLGGTAQFIHIFQPMVITRASTGSMSMDKLKSALHLIKLVERHGKTMKKQELAQYYARIGLHFAESYRNADARAYMLKSVRTGFAYEAWLGLPIIMLSPKLFLSLYYKLYRRIYGYS